jgi:cardiolipin synthase
MRSFLQNALALGLAVTTLVGCGHAGLVTTPTHRAAGALHSRSVSQTSLFVIPDQGITPILSAINGAQHTIVLEMYMFTDHDLTAQLVAALTARAAAHVDVRVLLEPHPYTGNTPGPGPNVATAQALVAGGVKVQDSNPRFKYTHEKAMVIDGNSAWIMTCNFTNSAFTANREYAVADTNPLDVQEVTAIFQADWNRTAFTPSDPNLVVSPDNSRKQLLNLIDSAKKSIAVQCEVTGDPEIASHLGARAKAGIDVKVELASLSGPTSANESQQLNAAGVTQVIFSTKLHMHAKTILVDQTRAYIGSENLSSNSLDNNRELGIIIADPAAITTLANTIATDWTAH